MGMTVRIATTPVVMRSKFAAGVGIDFTGTYATGGYTLTPAACGLTQAPIAVLCGSPITTNGYLVVPTYAAATGVVTIRLFRTAGQNAALSELPAGTDISSESASLLVLGW